jgi:hypothetical protein
MPVVNSESQQYQLLMDIPRDQCYVFAGEHPSGPMVRKLKPGDETAIQPRLLPGKTAAAYCGVTPTTFSKWIAAGTMPGPVIGRRWDLRAIDLALDRLSGLGPAPSEEEEDPFEVWRRENAQKIAKPTSGNAAQSQEIREAWEDEFDAAWAERLVEHAAWNAQQPSAKQSSPTEVERARQALRNIWRDRVHAKRQHRA